MYLYLAMFNFRVQPNSIVSPMRGMRKDWVISLDASSALTVLETHDGNFAESVVIAVNNAITDLDAHEHEQAQQGS